jgi:epoxyqueuosine reductase
MKMSSCVSYLTTFGAGNSANNANTDKWVFGCDACQDVCPFNHNKWKNEEHFPGLNELSENITLEKIIDMDYDFLQNVMAKKFWYINKDEVHKWKINALHAMSHNYHERYFPYIDKACNDRNDSVQMAARRIKE